MRAQRLGLGFAIGTLLTLALTPPAPAQTPLTTERVGTGFSFPLYLTAPEGDLQRLFIVEKTGRIKIIKNGVTLPQEFIHLGSGGGGLGKVGASGSEQGLLGLAFHPDYANNGFFYVNYTNTSGNTVIERYKVSANPDLADTGTGTTIIGPISQPQTNHNGGCIQFGADGMLYIGMGDGGGGNDTGTGHATGGNAQSGSTLLGKMLRLDVDIPFPHIPASNPFVGNANFMDEIWALGVRNPWRFSFDRATGELYIGDVGQDAREEITWEPAGMGGLNHGWRCMEGFNCTGLSGCTCNSAGLTLPIHDYAHTPGCVTVTGGYVYRGCAIPDLVGTYVFGDYCRPMLWSFEWDGATQTNFTVRTAELDPPGPQAIGLVSSFGEDGSGELYICDASDGEIYKIVPANAVDCNVNGVADGCDIANGTSLDLNGNFIPDECECNPPPVAYCTAQNNSQGCLPAVQWQGAPRVGNPIPFLVEADQIVNNKVGILFYGVNGRNTKPFLGGLLCVKPPLKRTPTQDSGGSGQGNDCSGRYSFDFNVYIASGQDAALVAGQKVNAQFWSRDPQALGTTTNLSDAIEFTICN